MLVFVTMALFVNTVIAVESTAHLDAPLHPCEHRQLDVGPEARIRLVQDKDVGFGEIEKYPELFQNKPVNRGLGFTSSAIWVSLTVANPTNEPCSRWLVVKPRLQKYIRLHLRTPNGMLLVSYGGAASEASERGIGSVRHAIFPIVLEAGAGYQAYLEFQGDALMQFQIAFWEPDAFIEQEYHLNASRYLLIGSSTIMLFSTLLFSLLWANWRLLLGGCAWICAVLYTLIRDGYFSTLYSATLAEPHQQLMQSMSALFLASYCGFAAAALPDTPWSKSLRRVLQWLAMPAAIFAVVYLFISLPAIAVLSSGVILVCITAMLVVAALHGGGVGWAFLSGWLLLNVATVLRIVNGFGWAGIDQAYAELIGPLSFGASALITSFALYRAYLKAQHETRKAERALQRRLESERDRLLVSVNEATAEIKAVLRQVEAASLEKSRFLAMVAHELNSPLHAVQGNIKLAITSSRGSAKERLERVSKATSSLIELVDQTLRFSRGETTAVVLDPVPFLLKDVIDDLLDFTLAKHGSAATRVQCRFAGPLPDIIETDEEILRKVLVNIVDNAVKYAPEGSIELLIEALDDDWPEGDGSSEQTPNTPLRLRFSVQDQGPGIAAEFHDKVFEPFTRLVPNVHQRGVGLGLAICQQLLHAMSSQLELNSSLGQGSCFYFDLVVTRVQEARLIGSLPFRHFSEPLFPAGMDEGMLGVAREFLELGQLVKLENWARALKVAHPDHRELSNQIIADCANIDLGGLRRLLQPPITGG